MSNNEDTPKPILQDKDFILDCLCWHNEYRARHSAPALTVSPGVSIFFVKNNSCIHTGSLYLYV